LANGEASEGLFASAIMESGTCDSPELYLPGGPTMDFGADFARLIWGCDYDDQGSDDGESSSAASFLECARGKTTEDLMYGFGKALERVDDETRAKFSYLPPLFPAIPFATVVDGSVEGIPVMPLQALKDNSAMNVPLIIGTNKDEGTIFVPLIYPIVNNVSSVLPSKMTTDDLAAMIDQIICTPTYTGPGVDGC
jgi:para-nitrobenzyl esterase